MVHLAKREAAEGIPRRTHRRSRGGPARGLTMRCAAIAALFVGACLQATGREESPASRLPQDNAPTAQPDKVATPLTLPGAEAFIYHEVKPEPMRLHVFKPK